MPASTSASLATIAAARGAVIISCTANNSRPACCPIHRVSGALAVERWGAGATIAALEARMRCLACRGKISVRPEIPWMPEDPKAPPPFTGVRSCWGDPYARTFDSWAAWEPTKGR